MDFGHRTYNTECEKADFELNEAMKKASKGAGLVISLGNVTNITYLALYYFIITSLHTETS